jgi:hypothetical protein
MGEDRQDIEVTEEMILAGVGAMPYLAVETCDSHWAEKLVLVVYRAMRKAEEEGRLCHQETSETPEPREPCS